MPCSKASGDGKEVFHHSKEGKETVLIPYQGMIESGKSIACLGLKTISKMSDDENDSKKTHIRPL